MHDLTESHSRSDFLSFRISPTDNECVEGWTGSVWKTDAYFRNAKEAIVSLALDREEGATVELTDEMIQDVLRKLRIDQKRIAYHINVLERALDVSRPLDRDAPPSNI